MSSASWNNRGLFSNTIAILVSCSLAVSMLCGCSLDFRHLHVFEGGNESSGVSGWDEAETLGTVETWDTADIASWEELDELTDPIYAAALFDESIIGFPEIDVAVLDYRSNGQYFEGEKVYELIGNRFDLNKLIGDVAVGTTVLVVCVVIETATAGSGTPIAVFFAGTAETAGAAKNAISMAKMGTVLGGAMGAVSSYMESDADWGQTLYGTLEGAADGFRWGAVFGAVSGGAQSWLSEMPKSVTKLFPEGSEQAKKYPKGIRFDSKGYPRFEPYKIAQAKFELPTPEGVLKGTCLSGQYARDAKLANKLCGYASTPQGYVWHHVEDMTTMILVPQDLHSVVFGGMWHKGGASLIRALLQAAV